MPAHLFQKGCVRLKQVFKELLDAIPDYQQFLTVDEMDASSKALAKAHPDTVELFDIGKTTLGHPILCLKIGNGPKNALLTGCPHPNEPIGAMMCEHFSWYLAGNKALRDELGYTWYIVKTWDADGVKLNEGWLKGPYSIRNYARNFYRPAGTKQVEWTFPIKYKDLDFQSPIAETQAMIGLLDKIQPDIIYSLHNAGFGGVFWYVGEGLEAIYDDLYKAAEKQGVPLSLGEPEAPFCVELAPAVYKMVSQKAFYDYLEQYGTPNIPEIITAGECSAEYAKERWGTFTFLTEMPYFYNEHIMDRSESDMIRKDAALWYLDFSLESNRIARELLALSAPYIAADCPFLLAVKDFTRDEHAEVGRKMYEESPEYQKLATVAEKYDSLLMRPFYTMLVFGMLVRMNESALAEMEKSGEQNEAKKNALQNAFRAAEEEFNRRARYLEENIDYQVIPIKKLVSIMLESGVLIADHLNQ